MQVLEQRVEHSEERIDHLDAILGQFIAGTGAALISLGREMKEFKDEMKEFKDEMKEFKDEMSDYKDWSKSNILNMNFQWGNLARKMGTLIEDIFYPSSDIVIEKYFKMTPSSSMIRKRVRRNGNEFEADILAVCEAEKTAFIFEIKSNPDNSENLKEFKQKLEKAPEFLDEIKGMKLIPVYGGLTMNQSMLNSLTKNRIYAVIFKGDVLEIPNFENLNSGKK